MAIITNVQPVGAVQIIDTNGAIYTIAPAGTLTLSNGIVNATALYAMEAAGQVTVSGFTPTGATIGSLGASSAQIGGITLNDGVNSTLRATVTSFHNADNQALGTSLGLNTGGVAQLLNGSGNIDRQRETGFDNIPAAGIASGTQQLASPITGLSTTQSITASGSAQTVNVSGLTVTSRGAILNIQVGSMISIDSGVNQEYVCITSIGTNTITGVFTKSHATSMPFTSFSYNQARDGTIADGTTGVGIAANSTFLLNANTGWEAERSAAGELDGASGVGTAVAAEYEYNGNGPHGAYDRARSIQGKFSQTLALSGSPATGQAIATLSSAAPASLQVGMSVQLTGGTTETLGIKTIAGTSITFTSNILNASHTGLVFESFNTAGPGLNGFSSVGMGIEEEAVYDPVSGLFYLERSATQDGVAATNVVMENAGLFNGTTLDRARAAIGAIGAESTRGGGVSNTYNVAASTVIKAAPGRVIRISVITAGSTTGTLNDCTTTGAAAAANQIASVPNVVGVIYLDWPTTAGLVYVPGTGQVAAINWD